MLISNHKLNLSVTFFYNYKNIQMYDLFIKFLVDYYGRLTCGSPVEPSMELHGVLEGQIFPGLGLHLLLGRSFPRLDHGPESEVPVR